jgi:hemerythrin superfamily protein
MAQAKRKTKSRSKNSSSASSKRGGFSSGGATRQSKSNNGKSTDAIALLKADHRQVEDWFEQFEKARSDDKKQDLATKICRALKAHTAIEEEIFYHAFLDATDETDLHHEAEVEHDGAKKLIAEIESSGPDDEYFDAKVSVLSEMIKHHVNEEEQRGGMFAKAKQADMDLAGLGEQLRQRKDQVMAEIAGEGEGDERVEVSPELLRRDGRRSRQESARRK